MRVEPIAANLARMPYGLAFLILASFIGAGCELPVCGTGLLEVDRRCVAELVEPKCIEACDAQAHEVCNTSLENPVCTCAPGYEGNPCTWGGALKDTGFGNAEAWTFTNSATVSPDEPAPKDVGIAYLRPSVVCNGGAVGQTVEMPPYEAAEPFVAEVTYRAENVYGIAVGYNRAWRTLPPTGPPTGESGEWVSKRVCLGEAAYGGPVLFQVGSGDQLPACFTNPVGEIEVDRFAIRVALPDECPALGEVLNGQADEDKGGWDFFVEEGATGVEAGFDSGFDETGGPGGSQSSSGARIYREAVSSGQLGMSTKLSVPLPSTLASPALRFWWRGTSGNRFHGEIGTFEVGRRYRAIEDFEGTGSDDKYAYCLPPWTHGNVVELGFSILLNTPPQTAELVVDDVEIISYPDCGDSNDLLDPGFESAPNRIIGVTTTGTSQSIELKKDPELARTGDGVLELVYWDAATLIFFETWVYVPPISGIEGPAFEYYSRVPNREQGDDPALPARTVLGRAAVEPADLPISPVWTRKEVCLPQKWSDRWFRVQLRVGDFTDPMLPSPIDPPVELYLDDFAVLTSPACGEN